MLREVICGTVTFRDKWSAERNLKFQVSGVCKYLGEGRSCLSVDCPSQIGTGNLTGLWLWLKLRVGVVVGDWG